MYITIKDILKSSHAVIDQRIAMTEQQVRDGGFVGDVACSAKINRLKYRVYLKVSYSCTVKRECSRCLNSFEYPVKGVLSVVLEDKKVSKGLDDNEGTYDYNFSDTDTVIDIRQSLYEDVMVSLPIKPLCNADCQGIKDYNIKDATEKDSQQDAIDPRWEALKKFKKKHNN